MSQDKILFLLVTIISIAVLTSFAMSPFFNVKKIEYHGLELLKNEDLSTDINNYKNTNVFLLDQRKIVSTLMNNSLIKEVEVKKEYPDSIIINIKEREPIACIENFGEELIFTANGFIINEKLDISVPEIKGLAYSVYMDKLEFSHVFDEIVNALESIDIDIISSLRLIKYDEEEKDIIAYSNKIPIYLGNSDSLQEKFRILETLFYEINEDLLEIEYIDLKILNRPVIKRK